LATHFVATKQPRCLGNHNGGVLRMLAASVTRQEPEQTGYADVAGGRIWWRMSGARHLRSDRAPIIAVHGGPGGAHDYLEPLMALADERAVILYDQLDCGNSDRPGKTSNWTT